MALSVGSYTSLQVLCLEGVSGVERLRSAWNRLADDVPTRRWEWSEAWYRHFDQGGEPFSVVLTDDVGEVVGILPLVRRRRLLGGRVLTPLGVGEAASDHLGLLALPGWERPIAETVAMWLVTQAREQWDRLEFDRFETRQPANFWLLQTFEQLGLCVRHIQHRPLWRIALTQTWDAYLKWLPAQQRRVLREADVRWLHTGRITQHTAQEPLDLEQGLAALMQLEVQKRRGQDLGTHGWSVPFHHFAYDVLRRLFQLGRVRLHWLTCNDRPVAAWCGVAGGNTLYSYVQSIAANANPAWETLLTGRVLHDAVAEGFDYVDLGYPPDDAAQAWRGEPRTVTDVRVVPTHASARIRDRITQAAMDVRNWARPR